MNHILCYAPTAEQQQLLDYFDAAQREMEAALDLYRRALAHTKTWQSQAGEAAARAVVAGETNVWRCEQRVTDVGGALQRHFQAEVAARHYLSSEERRVSERSLSG